MDRLYGYINGPKQKLIVTESQYERLLREYEVREDINKVFDGIEVGDGILFSNNVLSVTKEPKVGYDTSKPTNDIINKFEVLNIHTGKSLKETGLFLKKVENGRYPKNIFFLSKDSFISIDNVVKTFMSIKGKINTDVFDDKLANDIMSGYEVDGNLDPSIWKKFDIKNVGYIQVSKDSKDFDNKENTKYVYSMEKNVEKGEKKTVIDEFKKNVRENFDKNQAYKFNFNDKSWLVLNIKNKVGSKIEIEFLSDSKDDKNKIDTKSYDNSGKAKDIVNKISKIKSKYEIKSIVFDVNQITHKFEKYDYSYLTDDRKLKLLDMESNELSIQNSSEDNIVSVNIPLVVIYGTDLISLAENTSNSGGVDTINMNGVINITQTDYEENVKVTLKDLKKAGWSNQALIDSMYKQPNAMAQLIFGDAAVTMHGNMGGTILIDKILSNWGLAADKSYGTNSDGEIKEFKILNELRINNLSDYDEFKNLLSGDIGKGYYKQYYKNNKINRIFTISNDNNIRKFKIYLYKELGSDTYEANLQRINNNAIIAKVKIQLL